MNFKKWLQGLASVAVSSAATGVTLVIVDPSAFNLNQGISKLGTVCLVQTILHVAMYLQKSPLPDSAEKSNP